MLRKRLVWIDLKDVFGHFLSYRYIKKERARGIQTDSQYRRTGSRRLDSNRQPSHAWDWAYIR